MKARITVMLKEKILDPQGKAIRDALGVLGFTNIQGVRQGKIIIIELDESDTVKCEKDVRQMCQDILANPVTENYDIEIVARQESMV